MKKHPHLTTEHAKEFYENATKFANPRIRRVPRFDYQNLPELFDGYLINSPFGDFKRPS